MVALLERVPILALLALASAVEPQDACGDSHTKARKQRPSIAQDRAACMSKMTRTLRSRPATDRSSCGTRPSCCSNSSAL